jgi:hypothetical protein
MGEMGFIAGTTLLVGVKRVENNQHLHGFLGRISSQLGELVESSLEIRISCMQLQKLSF